MRSVHALVALAVGAVPACAVLKLDFGTYTLADAGIDAADAGSDAACHGLRPPDQVLVTTDNGSFCIDATEVTNAQYADFLAAMDPPTLAQLRRASLRCARTTSASSISSCSRARTQARPTSQCAT